MSNLAPGDRIGERYRRELELARGSQGRLWRASDQLAGEAPVGLLDLLGGGGAGHAQHLMGIAHTHTLRSRSGMPRPSISNQYW